jgi:serine protease Do
MKYIGAILLALCGITAYGVAPARAQEVNADLEAATKAAVKKVAPSIVQIVTSGGADMVVTTPKGPAFRKALGPTTGVIVTEDGYVISSAFNFLNNPSTILVAIQGREEPLVAKKVATDNSRMLTLLKVDAKGLPVPVVALKKEITEGQWAIALGRALDLKRIGAPSVSVGIISAVGRIWGRAVQTDAKVSPLNYGGPLVDIQGRVQGILIPASPQGEGVTAGFEWYDSGIGFAIPMEDVLAILPKLKDGKDLQRGLLGVRMKTNDIYSVEPVIGEVVKNTAADRAGLKPGDVIIEVDGKSVSRMAQVLHILGTKYEGEKVSLRYRRDKEEHAVKDLQLVGAVQSAAHPFLGILPMRDDPKLGVEVRYVFGKSPAEKVGIKPGDRISKFGVGKATIPFTGAERGIAQLQTWLNTLSPGTEIALEIKRQEGKTDNVTVVLDQLPGSAAEAEFAIPEKLPAESSKKEALKPLEVSGKNLKPAKAEPAPEKVEKGVLKRTTADGEHKFWVYVPEDYDPQTSYGVLVWLHPPGQNKEPDFDLFIALWEDYCLSHRLILVMPISDNDAGWLPGESDHVLEAIQHAQKQWTVDPRRIVAHGMSVGGQMALHLGMNQRELIRGVATVGAVPTTIKDNQRQQRLAFYLAGGAVDPLIKSIAEGRDKLREKKYSVFYREIPERGREYLEDAQLRELARWIDMLDKQ